MLLDQLGGDVSGRTLPAINSLVDNVGDLEAVGVGLGVCVDLLLQDNILGGNVGKDEVNLGLVGLVLEEMANDLEHGGDAGSSSNQADGVELVSLEGVLANGTYYFCDTTELEYCMEITAPERENTQKKSSARNNLPLTERVSPGFMLWMWEDMGPPKTFVE